MTRPAPQTCTLRPNAPCAFPENAMTTVFTPMPIFSRPGPMLDLLEAHAFTGARIEVAKPITDENSIKALMERAPEIEYLIANTTPLDAAFFAAAANLKLVAMFGVGVEHIDLAAATRTGALVTNVPGGNARCVAELAFCFMLDLAHQATRMHMDMAAGAWKRRMGSEVTGKTLGIVGFGHIGQDMARLAKAFDMHVIFANRTPRPELAREFGAEQLPLGDVLAQADFLTLHIPGGPNSWHFGAKEFAAMKQGAFFINAARGEIMDLDALAVAVESGHLAGAGLDVFPEEPMDPAHPIFALPQVIATPHAGGVSTESMIRVAASCLGEVARVLNKQRSPNARNPEVYADLAGF